ncbi:MAG: hypothetical protein P4M14_07320 [Gammaproteobacteria bacterium]|nr:hypothetical protein [Gammaproteobacteria bacterium]
MINRNETHNALLSWLHKTIQQKPLSQKKQIALNGISALGMSAGALSAYVIYVLNAEFGTSVCDYIGIDDPKDIAVMENIFGLTAAISMAALGALNVKDSLTDLLAYLTEPEKSVVLFKKKSNAEIIARGFFALASPFSAIPQSTLTWNYTRNETIKRIATPCAILTPTLFNGRGGQRLIDKMKNKNASVITIENYLLSCKRNIQRLSPQDLEDFLQLIIPDENELNPDFLTVLFEVGQLDDLHPKNLSEKIFSLIGFLLGLTSAIIFYQLTLEGTDEPLALNSNILKHFFASLSYLLCAALSAIATQNMFETMQKIVFQSKSFTLSKANKAFLAIAILIAPFAALPLGGLQIENAQNGNLLQILLIAPTFMGPMCVRGRAIYDAMNRMLDFTTKACLKNNEQNKKRELLLTTLDNFQLAIKNFTPEAIEDLQERLSPRPLLPI